MAQHHHLAQSKTDKVWHLLAAGDPDETRPLCRTRKALDRSGLPKPTRDEVHGIMRLPHLHELEGLCPDCAASLTEPLEEYDYLGRDYRSREIGLDATRWHLTRHYEQKSLERSINQVADRLEKAAARIRQQVGFFQETVTHKEATDYDRGRQARHLITTTIEETVGVPAHSSLAYLVTQLDGYQRELAEATAEVAAYEAAYPGITAEAQAAIEAAEAKAMNLVTDLVEPDEVERIEIVEA